MHGEVVSCVNVLDLYRMFDNTLTLLIFAKYDRLKFEEKLNFRQVTPTSKYKTYPPNWQTNKAAYVINVYTIFLTEVDKNGTRRFGTQFKLFRHFL